MAFGIDDAIIATGLKITAEIGTNEAIKEGVKECAQKGVKEIAKTGGQRITNEMAKYDPENVSVTNVMEEILKKTIGIENSHSDLGDNIKNLTDGIERAAAQEIKEDVAKDDPENAIALNVVGGIANTVKDLLNPEDIINNPENSSMPQRGDFSKDVENILLGDNRELAPTQEDLKTSDAIDKTTKAFENTKVTENVEKIGGSYGDVYKEGEGDKYEVHHIPADSISPLEKNDGPSIKMEKEDHRQTASCGSSKEACDYRAEQKKLIEQGKFRDAVQMDIDDIHDKFGSKYDDAINEMNEYIDKIETEGKLNV